MSADAAGDVLGARDRVVDHDRYGRSQPREGDRVERLAEQVQDERGGHERKRNGEEPDQDRPPFEEERRGDEDREHAGDDEREHEVVHRMLDERRRPEERGVRLHPGQTGPKVLERRLHALGHGERIRAGELLDHEQETVGIVDDRVADQRLVVLDDVRHVSQAQSAAGGLDGHVAELLRIDELVEDVADAEALLWGLDEAAGTGCRALEEAERRRDLRVAGGLHDLLQRNAPVTQLLRVDLDLELPVAEPPDGDVGDTGHPEQAGPDRPAGDHRLLDR